MTKKNILAWLLVAVIVAAPSVSAFAAGYNLAGVGAKGLSMSGAFRAISDDWSAVFWNPAGLAGQGNAFSIEGKVLLPKTTLTDPTIPYYTQGENNSKGAAFPSGALGLTYMLNERMTLGLGIYAPTAIGVTWENLVVDPAASYGNSNWPDEDWKSDLRVIHFNPSMGYMVNDQLSVGVGFSLIYSSIMLQQPALVPNPDPNTSGMIPSLYAISNLEGTALGYGFNLGVKYDVNEDLHLGFSYRGPSTIPIDGSMTQDVYYPTVPTHPVYQGGVASNEYDATADLPLPMEAGLGVAYDVNDDLTVAFDIAWTNWATTGTVDIDLDGTSDQELKLEYEDVIRFNVGALYQMSDALELRLGYYYDPSAIPDKGIRPAITDVAGKHSPSLGVAYDLNESMTLSGYGEFLVSGTRTVDQKAENVGGEWSMRVFTFGLQLDYRF